MNKITKILLLIIIGLSLTLYISIKNWRKEKKNSIDKDIIIESNERIFSNKYNEKASEAKVWSLKYSTLEKIAKSKEGEKTELQKQLIKAKNDVDLYKRKEKDLLEHISYRLKSNDTVYLELPVIFPQLDPIQTEHLRLSFIYNNQNELIGFPYQYSNEISTLITLFPKKKSNGKNHFPNWGFIWGYDTYSITTSKDTNAIITNQVAIKFKR